MDNVENPEFSAISHIDDKNFTEFSKAVELELSQRLANSPEMQQYSSDYDKMTKIKDIFASIRDSSKEEPEVHEVPSEGE